MGKVRVPAVDKIVHVPTGRAIVQSRAHKKVALSPTPLAGCVPAALAT